jgi:hypothetical protein
MDLGGKWTQETGLLAEADLAVVYSGYQWTRVCTQQLSKPISCGHVRIWHWNEKWRGKVSFSLAEQKRKVTNEKKIN